MIESTSVAPVMLPQPSAAHRPGKIAAKHKHFLDSFRPLYYFSRSFGLMPFSIKRSSSGNILGPTVEKFDAVWFAATLCIYSIATVVSFRYVKFERGTNAQMNMLVIANNLHLTFGMLFCILSIGMDLYNRRSLTDLFRRFDAFDKNGSALGINLNFSKQYRCAWMYGVVAVVILLFLLIITSYNLSQSSYTIPLGPIYSVIPPALQNFLMTAVTISFLFLLHNLRERYADLNRYLRKRFLKNHMNVAVFMSEKQIIGDFKFIGRQYGCLADIMNHLNCCYSFQMLFRTGSCFVSCVTYLYALYRQIFKQDAKIEFSTLVHGFWLIFYLIGTFSIIYMSVEVTSEGKNTSRILHEISNHCEINVSLTQLSLQVQQQCPVFTCGLFVFDWTLLFTIIASLTTYLTIVINFEPQS